MEPCQVGCFPWNQSVSSSAEKKWYLRPEGRCNYGHITSLVNCSIASRKYFCSTNMTPWIGSRFTAHFMISLSLSRSGLPNTYGVVHAYVDQKLVKSNKLQVLIEDQNIGSRHCSTEYKRNTATTPPYSILLGRPPQQIIYSPLLSPSLSFDMSYPY